MKAEEESNVSYYSYHEWIIAKADDDDELMLNVLRCHLTY